VKHDLNAREKQNNDCSKNGTARSEELLKKSKSPMVKWTNVTQNSFKHENNI
jgi:hypothetical protein